MFVALKLLASKFSDCLSIIIHALDWRLTTYKFYVS